MVTDRMTENESPQETEVQTGTRHGEGGREKDRRRVPVTGMGSTNLFRRLVELGDPTSCPSCQVPVCRRGQSTSFR